MIPQPRFVVCPSLYCIYRLLTSIQNFLPKLKAHLLGRLLDQDYDGDEAEFTDEELRGVTIVRDRLYKHKVIRINYTTYDVRRSQDSLNPRTHADFMVLAHEESNDGTAVHPYWYGHIIAIFHADIRHIGSTSTSREVRRMEILWVRWYGRDLTYRSGWATKRLHRVGFVDSDDPGAFGFLYPNVIIRGAHLIPAFHYGQTCDLLTHSIARQPNEQHMDWLYFYVNM